MDFKIKYQKLYPIFEKMMGEYSRLERTEKSYDYWDSSKGRYADLNVLNFYRDIENDWEDDDWVLQYQDEPGDEGNDDELPILRYGEYPFGSLEETFGDYFPELFKNWFEETY